MFVQCLRIRVQVETVAGRLGIMYTGVGKSGGKPMQCIFFFSQKSQNVRKKMHSAQHSMKVCFVFSMLVWSGLHKTGLLHLMFFKLLVCYILDLTRQGLARNLHFTSQTQSQMVDTQSISRYITYYDFCLRDQPACFL